MASQPAVAATGKGLVRVGSFATVPDVLRDLGFDPATVLSGAGIDMSLFDSPENRISITTRSDVLQHCAEVTRCGHFGLLVGQRNGLHGLGLVGLLARYSEDVQTALSNLIRYFHLHVRGASISLTVHDGKAILGHQLYQSSTAAYAHTGDGAVAWLLNILHELCGHRQRPLEILLNHRPPDNIKPFRDFFRAPVTFNAGQNAVVFPAAWLAKVMPDVHADVRQLVQEKVDDLVARVGDDFPGQVREVLHVALHGGRSDLDYIASLFALHPRTLRRRLAAAGGSYQALLDEVRCDLARDMLSSTELGVSELALMLHYSDARAFIRAFRRWTGHTPAHWRAENRRRRHRAASP